jgi:glycosyltransferase involved in cell wall biosynthesis
LILTEVNAPYRESQEMKGKFRRPVVDAVRRLIYPRADMFAANSLDGVSEAIDMYGAVAERSRRLPNLIEPDTLKRLSDNRIQSYSVDRPLSICIVTRLYRRKRVDTLLRAASGIGSVPDWQIDIVGDGAERASLEQLTGELGIAERVRFHGWVQNPYPFISRATVCVLCSEFEGFSNSVLEAMALRTPVVTSLCTSDADDMCRQGAALGFQPGDHLALGAQLKRALTSRELRNGLVENGWRYLQPHTVPIAIRDYEALVRDAIRQRDKAKQA